MLVVKIFGGLGNQMFQYAFYQYLKLRNDEVYLDISDYKIHSHHNGFELATVFGIEVEKPNMKKFKGSTSNQNHIAYRLIDKLFHRYILGYSNFTDFQNVSVVRNENFLRNIYFTGYWQDVLYAQSVAPELQNIFEFIQPITDLKNIELIKCIDNTESISVHVRRGDYIENSHFLGICNKEYYVNAISLMKEKFMNPRFVIFSDDLEWCKKTFGEGSDLIYVDWNTREKSSIDMYLMSKCKHNIIANSTFSWWGAWLNKNPEKTVICPKIWSHKTSQNHLLVDGWISI